MNPPVSCEWASVIACFGLAWGVLSTLLWLWIVLRVITALEGLSRAHAELANAVHRLAERLPVKEAGPGEMDWRTDQPPPRVVDEG
jgi:predicted ferric reductase